VCGGHLKRTARVLSAPRVVTPENGGTRDLFDSASVTHWGCGAHGDCIRTCGKDRATMTTESSDNDAIKLMSLMKFTAYM